MATNDSQGLEDLTLRRFNAERDGEPLARELRRTFKALLTDDNEDFMDPADLAELLGAHDLD